MRDWKQLAKDAAREPVKVTDEAAETLVVLTEAEFSRLKDLAWDRLALAMKRLTAEAASSGLTEDKLDKLLADES